ncbi:MAG: DinB family protein [Spirulina sp.]
MNLRNHYQLMAQYNQWMNEKIYGICQQIPDRDRKKDLGAFFKSIHGTLNHLLYGDLAWMERLAQNRYTPQKIDSELFHDFSEMRRRRESLDREIVNWTKRLSEAWLIQPFTYTSNVDGKTRTLPTWCLLTHMFNHQTHHRGQVTTLIKQLGYDPGITDIPWMPQFEGNVN